MKSILIKDTTREERISIVHQALTGMMCIEQPSQSQPHPVMDRHQPPPDEAPVHHQAVFPGSYG